MVKIQLELNKEENKIVNVFKAKSELKTKQEAIKAIILEKGGMKW